jgi:flagellar hook-associated protein 1
MSDLLSIGASGVRAYQSALTTTSENIANSGTAGYVRRTATLSEVAATGFNQTNLNGMGVSVSGIARAGDMFRNAEVRASTADLNRTSSGITVLSQVEDALTGGQLGARLTAFFNAAQTVAADPTATAARSTMLEAATGVATAFGGTSDALAAAAAELDDTTDNAVGQLNNLTASLAKINVAIGRTAPGTSGAAAILDQRDQLLEQMSALTDVDVSLDAAGRATVRAGNGGPVLVSGDDAGTVTAVRDGGTLSFAVLRDGESSTVSPTGGTLAGLADGAQRIADAQGALDTLATSFVDGVNAVQAQGRDLGGNAGAAMFAAGDPPSQVSMTLSDPRGIAAASTGEGTRGNGNLAALASLRTGAGYEDKLTALTTANATALSGRKTVAAAQGSIHDAAVAARDNVSGVSIDEEAVNLMRFQQAYQASSRVIQVARETLQSILDIR